MTKYISIDPGKCKCGLIFADLERKIVLQAIVIESKYLVQNIKSFVGKENNLKVLIGNGTTSNDHAKSLSFLENNLTTVSYTHLTLPTTVRV